MNQMEQAGAARRTGGERASWKVVPLANDYTTVYTSPDPQRVYTGSPSIETGDAGRLIATMDLFGPGVPELPGPRGDRPFPKESMQGKVFTSDDGGRTWQHRTDFPFMHARVFKAGGKLYVLGHCGDIRIMMSEDNGTTWSRPCVISEDSDWTQAPGNTIIANGCVYLVMMKMTSRAYRGYFISVLAPVLLRAPLGSDLTDPASWSCSQPASPFRELLPAEELNYGGFPFFPVNGEHAVQLTADRRANAIGWHEAHVVQIHDERHAWFDPSGRTFHIFARFENHLANYTAFAKVVEREDGTMTLGLETAPSGKVFAFAPMPGGQMKFHLVYDEPTALYWLVSTQAIDSMTRLDRLPAERFNLPYNERRRLQLHYSKNMIDWCFAGYVCEGDDETQARHYCSMTIDGDDLLVLSRSGDRRAKNAHDTNLITFHRITDFRELVY